MKYITESTAFAALAKRIQKRGLSDAPGAGGLCYEVADMVTRGEITDDLCDVMFPRISGHIRVLNTKRDGTMKAHRTVYLCTPGLVEPRIIAAQLLALEAADDEEHERKRAEIDARTNYVIEDEAAGVADEDFDEEIVNDIIDEMLDDDDEDDEWLDDDDDLWDSAYGDEDDEELWDGDPRDEILDEEEDRW